MAPNAVSLFSAIITVAISSVATTNGCQFYPVDNHFRFVRLSETTPVGSEVMQIEVHPRRNLSLQPIDNHDDVAFFKFRTINRTTISLRLARSLDDLVDRPNPVELLKVKLVCGVEDVSFSSSIAITAYVDDVNDNSPYFINTPYGADISESTPIGTTVVRGIKALDADKPSTPNSEVQYLIAASKSQAKFSLVMDANGSAAVVLKEPLSYDTGDEQFLLEIFAKDDGTPSRNGSAVVDVRVRRDESRVLKFTSEVYHSQFKEHFPITGKQIIQEIPFNPPIHAFYENNALNASIQYSLMSEFDDDVFHIDPVSGRMYLDKEIDADSLPSNIFLFKIQAIDTNNPAKTAFAEVEVEAIDVNDNQPKFDVDSYNASVYENTPNGYNVLRVIATDLDQGDNGEFVYHLVDPSQAFTIDGKTGWITVRNQTKLDREQKSSFSLRVYAREKIPFVLQQKETGDAFVSVEITVLDVNDNGPTFVPSNQYAFKTRADSVGMPGAVIGKVEAVDPDEGDNGRVEYRMSYSPNNGSEVFGVKPDTGEVFVNEAPLHPGTYTIIVNASDQPADPREMKYSLAVVTITINTEEIANPDFVNAPYEFWVGSDVPVGTSVGQVRIHSDNPDIDYDLLHTYPEGVPFAVEEKTGTISVVEVISNFDRTDYEFEAVATDNQNLIISTNVTIHVVYSDSSQTKTVDPVSLVFRVRENLPGVAIGRLWNVDLSNSSTLSKPNFIVTDPDDGELFTVSEDGVLYTKSGLDRETKDSFKLTVIADQKTKTGVHHATIFQIRISVDDENDNAPEFQQTHYEGTVLENSGAGTRVELNAPVRTIDRDLGPNSVFTLALRGEGSETFAVDADTGDVVVTGAAAIDRETRDAYRLTVVATDRGNLSAEASLTVRVADVNDNAPAFRAVAVYGRDKVRAAAGGRSAAAGVTVTLDDRAVPRRLDNATVTAVVWLPETVQPGTPVLAVRAEDADGGAAGGAAPVVYRLARGALEFAVHPVTGQLSVVGALRVGEQELNVTAEDEGGRAAWMLIVVVVEEDVLFQKKSYEFWVPEGSYKNHEIGCIVTDETSVAYSLSKKSYRNPVFAVSDAGCLLVSGDLDRETRDTFDLRLTGKRRSGGGGGGGAPSTAELVVRLLDVNDNAPQFRNHHRVRKLTAADVGLTGFEGELAVPVYEATLSETAAVPGAMVTRVVAEDPDGPDDGNADVRYGLFGPGAELFAVDAATGVVTVRQPLPGGVYNVTVVASDSGFVRKDNAALLVVGVADKNGPAGAGQAAGGGTAGADEPLLELRYFEVEVEENCLVPLEILRLNVSARFRRFASSVTYSVIPSENSESFETDPKNGNVYLIESPDRESTPTLTVMVRVEVTGRKGKSTYTVHPVAQDIALNEARIVLRIVDQNDNSPTFVNDSMPVIAAVSPLTGYGTPVATVQAVDPDQGVNADVRYAMVGDPAEKRYFSVDEQTGLIRTVAGFGQLTNDTVFGFDVRATDRAGASDGRSAITNVFIYILDDRKIITLALGKQPSVVEKHTGLVTSSMTNITGCLVKIWRIDSNTNNMTDIQLYAVDPITNALADSDLLMNLMLDHQDEIGRELKPLQFVGFSRMPKGRGDAVLEGSLSLYTTLELLTVLFGFVIFMGAITGVACVCTGRKREKSKKTITSYGNFGFHERSPFTLTDGSLGRLSTCEPRSLQNPTSFMEGSLLYGGGAVTNPKHLRRGLRCSNQPRSVVPVEPPVAHAAAAGVGVAVGRPSRCGRSRGTDAHDQHARQQTATSTTDCSCSCSSATGSTGTASLTGSFVMKSSDHFEDSLRSMDRQKSTTNCQRHHRCCSNEDGSNKSQPNNVKVCKCPLPL